MVLNNGELLIQAALYADSSSHKMYCVYSITVDFIVAYQVYSSKAVLCHAIACLK
jgi:hypothetical protein